LKRGKKQRIGFFTRLLLVLSFLLISPQRASAAGLSPELAGALQGQMEAAGVEQLQERLPNETQQLLSQLLQGKLDIGRLLSLSPGDFVELLVQLIREGIRRPFAAFGMIGGIILLCALAGALGEGFQAGELSSVYTAVSVLCVVAAVAKPVSECIVAGAQAIRDCSVFMLSFIPVFTSVVSVSGAPVTASTYNLLLFSACQLVSGVASGVLVPFMGMYTGLCIAGSVGEDIGILPLAKGIRSFVTWGLTLLMTAYAGLLSMQTLVSTGADGAMLKAGKFLVGSFVPIVGGAISDALGAAQGAMKLLKASIGAFGILAGALSFLPVLLKVLLWYLALKCGGLLCGMLAMGKLRGLLEACSDCLMTMLALLFSFMLLIIVSIVLLLSLSGG
jgi:stage III sporulation protein AE